MTTGPQSFRMVTHKGSRVGGKLEGIFEQRTVVSMFSEYIFVITSDSTFTAQPLLLLVDSVVIPHRK